MNKNIMTGIGWGVVATITMSTLHFLARAAGVLPMWKPVPAAVVRRIFGSGMPEPLFLVLVIGSHLAYGAFWAGVLWTMARSVTISKGIGLGVFLWFIMQLLVLPFLGWGIFGGNIKIAAGTLFDHLIYGTMLGWLGARSTSTAPRTP